MVTAAWLPGFESLHNADAQRVADEITAIGANVTPDKIVEVARDSRTELHKCFEWRDDIAAQKWRLQQARQIVCHLVIKETIAEDKPPVRFLFTGWSATFEIACVETAYSLDSVTNIINLAGFGLGIGSGRTSGYGRYHVTAVESA